MILPLIACVAIALWLAGWRRGAAVWCCGTAATLGVMLVLKLAFRACGPEVFGGAIESPSGHTAAAGAVYGSILAFLNSRLGGPKASRFLIVLATVTLIGATRVLLGAHTIQETLLGGAIGFMATQAMLSAAGEPVRGKPVTLWSAPLLSCPYCSTGITCRRSSTSSTSPRASGPFRCAEHRPLDNFSHGSLRYASH